MASRFLASTLIPEDREGGGKEKSEEEAGRRGCGRNTVKLLNMGTLEVSFSRS